jgi:hypothetical protein
MFCSNRIEAAHENGIKTPQLLSPQGVNNNQTTPEGTK